MAHIEKIKPSVLNCGYFGFSYSGLPSGRPLNTNALTGLGFRVLLHKVRDPSLSITRNTLLLSSKILEVTPPVERLVVASWILWLRDYFGVQGVNG